MWYIVFKCCVLYIVFECLCVVLCINKRVVYCISVCGILIWGDFIWGILYWGVCVCGISYSSACVLCNVKCLYVIYCFQVCKCGILY